MVSASHSGKRIDTSARHSSGFNDRKHLRAKGFGLPDRAESVADEIRNSDGCQIDAQRDYPHAVNALQAHPPQPERVSDDAHGGQRHRGGSNDRREQDPEHRIQ